MKRRPPKSTLITTRFPIAALLRSRRCPARSFSIAWDCSRDYRDTRSSPPFPRHPARCRYRGSHRPSFRPSHLRAERSPDCRKWKTGGVVPRSEEHTSELQSLMRISYAVFCLKKKKPTYYKRHIYTIHTYVATKSHHTIYRSTRN